MYMCMCMRDIPLQSTGTICRAPYDVGVSVQVGATVFNKHKICVKYHVEDGDRQDSRLRQEGVAVV